MKQSSSLMLAFLILFTALFSLNAFPAKAEESAFQPSEQLILVGDSRTVDIYDAYHNTNLSSLNKSAEEAYYIAQNGKAYGWFSSTALPTAVELAEPGDCVVILMGVNDLKTNHPKNYIYYATLINEQAYAWAEEGIKTFVVSVCPVGKTGSGKNGSYTYKKTTIYNKTSITNWNKNLKAALSADVTYIDVYSSILGNFKTRDKLHYQTDTSKAIYQKVLNAVKADESVTLKRSGSKYTLYKGSKKYNYTGFYYVSRLGAWVYFAKGSADFTYTGLYKSSVKGAYGWYYVKKGKVNLNYTGLAKNANGTYYVENGKVSLQKNGKVKVKGKTYTLKNSKVIG